MAITNIMEINPGMADDLRADAKKFAYSIEKRIEPFVESVESGTPTFYSVEMDHRSISDITAYIERVSKRLVWKAVELRNLGWLSGVQSFPEGWLTAETVLGCLGFGDAADALGCGLVARLLKIAESRKASRGK